MWRKRGQKYKLGLMLIAMSCLNCCATINCEPLLLPEFPRGGPQVADELQHLSSEEYPNLWEWLARLHKLKLELETTEG